MKSYVVGLRLLPLVMALFGLGCTKAAKPEILMSSLSLPSLKSTGDNPFNNNQSTFVIAGSCISMVSTFEVKIDDFDWVPVPTAAATPGVGETAPIENGSPVVWDQNCSDGQFKFWLHLSQFHSWLASFGKDSGYQPSVIRFRGIGGIFYTDPMEYVLTRNGGGGGNGNTNPPHHLAVRKGSQPVAGMSEGICSEFVVSLKDSANETTSTSSSYQFRIMRTRVSDATPVTSSSFIYYMNWQDCYMGTSPLSDASNISVAGNTWETRFYYRPSANGDASGGSVKFEPLLNSGLSLAGASASLTLPIRYGYFSYYLHLNFPSSGLVKGICYPFDVLYNNYDGMTGNHADADVDLTFQVDDSSKLKVYSDATCSTVVSSPKLAGTATTASFYVKADANYASSSSVFRVSGVDARGVSYPVDSGEYQIYWDSADHAAPTKLSMMGANSPSGDTVYTVQLVNDHYCPVPAPSGGVTANLSVGLVDRAGWVDLFNPANSCTYYSYSNYWNCSTPTPASSMSLSFAAGEMTKQAMLRPQWGGPLNLGASASGLSSASYAIAIYNRPWRIAISGLPSTVSHDACLPVTLMSQSYAPNPPYNSYSLASPVTINMAGLAAGEGLFSDADCRSSASNISISSGNSQSVYYWRPKNITASTVSRVLAANPVGGLEGMSMTISALAAPTMSMSLSTLNMGQNEPLYPTTVGIGATPLSFSFSGDGSNTGLTPGLNSVVYTSGVSAATLNLTDARGAVSGNLAVAPVATSFEGNFLTAVGGTPLLQLANAFAAGGTAAVTGDLSFNRSSSATYYDANGILTTAANDTPRFDHNPSDPSCGTGCAKAGLLLEEPSTNLMTYSENTNGWFGPFSGQSDVVNPQGLSSTVSTNDSDSYGFPGAYKSVYGMSSGTVFTFSAFIRYRSGTDIVTMFSATSPNGCIGGVLLNFTTGAAGQPNGWCPAALSYGAVALPNGWYRVWFTALANYATMDVEFRPAYNSNATDPVFWTFPNSYGLGAVDFWGLQVEQKPMMTSYIASGSTPGSRSGDILYVKTSAAGGGWMNSAGGAIKLEWDENSSESRPHYSYAVTDNSLSVSSQLTSNGTNWSLSGNATATLLDIPTKGLRRIATSYSSIGASLGVGGGLSTSAGNSTFSGSPTRLYLTDPLGSVNMTGHLRRLKIWNAVLGDPAVQSMGIVTPP